VIAPVSNHLNYPNGNRNATTLVAEATRNNPAVYPSAEARHPVYPATLPPATERVRTRIWSKVKNGQ
jgi:putrescine transport system substrate-binding protein